MGTKTKKTTKMENKRIYINPSLLFSCDMCSRSFPTRAALNGHKRWHSTPSRAKMSVKMSPKMSPEPQVTITCSKCQKTFSSGKSLRRHMISIHGPKLKCTFCSKTFDRRDRLLRHIRNSHKRKPFECPVPGCDATFMWSKEQRQHLKSAHDSEERSKRSVIKTDDELNNPNDPTPHSEFNGDANNPKTSGTKNVKQHDEVELSRCWIQDVMRWSPHVFDSSFLAHELGTEADRFAAWFDDEDKKDKEHRTTDLPTRDSIRSLVVSIVSVLKQEKTKTSGEPDRKSWIVDRLLAQSKDVMMSFPHSWIVDRLFSSF